MRLASRAAAPADAASLRELGIHVEPHADLDADPGPAEIAYLDVVDARGRAAGASGCGPRGRASRASATCCSNAGTGRPSASRAPPARRRPRASPRRSSACAGIDVAVSRGARAGNLWPTGDLLDRLRRRTRQRSLAPRPVLLLELTSSHLAFMSHSPDLAAVISFWPDHLELHGDLARYRSAKETIVRHQQRRRHRGRRARRCLRRLRRLDPRRLDRVLARATGRARRVPRSGARSRRRRTRPARRRSAPSTTERPTRRTSSRPPRSRVAAGAGADGDRAGHRHGRRSAVARRSRRERSPASP